MNWRTFAEKIQKVEGGDTRDKRDDSPASAPIVPIVPIVPLDPSRALRQWKDGLARLDPCAPPAGWVSNRWQQLVDDADWIFDTFGEQLAQEGWSALDVFGVLPWREGGGVLLDRLHGARNLRLDGEGRAYWSAFGVTSITCRGAAEWMVSSGLVLVWEF